MNSHDRIAPITDGKKDGRYHGKSLLRIYLDQVQRVVELDMRDGLAGGGQQLLLRNYCAAAADPSQVVGK